MKDGKEKQIRALNIPITDNYNIIICLHNLLIIYF